MVQQSNVIDLIRSLYCFQIDHILLDAFTACELCVELCGRRHGIFMAAPIGQFMRFDV